MILYIILLIRRIENEKITPIILIIVILMVVTATFMGCGDKDSSDLEKRIGELENKYNDLDNKYNKLDERIKKLETTISLLDTVGDSTQFIELKNKVIELQKDLVNNTANAAQIKTQVTQMQLVLDKISGGGNVDPAILGEIQNKLNTLYGEVNRVLPFENGKEYEVKLNGVVYYTVSVLIEYHDGVVNSQQDIKVCESDYAEYRKEHFCGSIVINNKQGRAITLSQIKTSVIYKFDDVYYGQALNISNKIGLMDDEVKTTVESGEVCKFYFHIVGLKENKPKENVKFTFRLPALNALILLTLDNVWEDENGLNPPIVGTKD